MKVRVVVVKASIIVMTYSVRVFISGSVLSALHILARLF